MIRHIGANKGTSTSYDTTPSTQADEACAFTHHEPDILQLGERIGRRKGHRFYFEKQSYTK
jgi:hypothetical protein